jgi:hypothetical protein
MQFTARLSLIVARRKVGNTQVEVAASPAAFAPHIGAVLPLIRGKNMRDLIGTAQITAIEGDTITVEGFAHVDAMLGEVSPGGMVEAYEERDGARVVTVYRLACFSI